MAHRQASRGSKWFKYQVMKSRNALHRYLPDTERYSEQRLRAFLERYPIVFIKPELGAGGRKVVRVLRDGKGGYEVHVGQRAKVLRSVRGVHRVVERVAKGKRFLIQQGIDLAHWNGRPVDIRTILQINEKDRWEVTGIFCKMAGRQLAVTNVCAGGSAHPIERYLKALGYGREQREELVEQLKEMSLAIVKPFADRYSNSIYGLDIGLDASGRLFLIELNTIPRLGIFRQMKLHSMYQRSTYLHRYNNTEARKKHLQRLPVSSSRHERQEGSWSSQDVDESTESEQETIQAHEATSQDIKSWDVEIAESHEITKKLSVEPDEATENVAYENEVLQNETKTHEAKSNEATANEEDTAQ